MDNSMFDVFFYLENHINWVVKVCYYISENNNFVEKRGTFKLYEVISNKAIKVLNADGIVELQFFGPESFIKLLDISCEEGFFIRIYENSKEKIFTLDNNALSGNEKNDIYISYNQYCNERRKIINECNMLLNCDSLFSNKSKVYMFSNEPVLAFFSDIQSLYNKSVLSILASGDFFFNSCLLGCNDMTLIDINEYAFYYFEIKKAIIKKYSYKDFLAFYDDLNNFYNKFDEYSVFISEDTKKKILDIFNSSLSDSFSIISTFFWSDSYFFNNNINIDRRRNIYKKNNLYLINENNYNKLKDYLLSESVSVNTYAESIFDLDFDSLKKYDYIYLSNIGDYYSETDILFLLEQFRQRNLNPNGKIILVYRTDNYSELLKNTFCKIIKYDVSNGGSLKNVILFCSFD